MNSVSKLSLVLAFAVVSILTIGQFGQVATFRKIFDEPKGESGDGALQLNRGSTNDYKNEFNEVITSLQSIINASTKEIKEQSLRVERAVDKIDTNALNDQIGQLIKLINERTELQTDESSVERYTKDELYNLFVETVLKGRIQWVSL